MTTIVKLESNAAQAFEVGKKITIQGINKIFVAEEVTEQGGITAIRLRELKETDLK